MTVVSKSAESFHRSDWGKVDLHFGDESRRLLVQDHTQEGTVDVKSAVVTNEAKFPELIHEKIDPGACCANHFRQHLL